MHFFRAGVRSRPLSPPNLARHEVDTETATLAPLRGLARGLRGRRPLGRLGSGRARLFGARSPGGLPPGKPENVRTDGPVGWERGDWPRREAPGLAPEPGRANYVLYPLASLPGNRAVRIDPPAPNSFESVRRCATTRGW